MFFFCVVCPAQTMTIKQKGSLGSTKPPMELACHLVTSLKGLTRPTWIAAAMKSKVRMYSNRQVNGNALLTAIYV